MPLTDYTEITIELSARPPSMDDYEKAYNQRFKERFEKDMSDYIYNALVGAKPRSYEELVEPDTDLTLAMLQSMYNSLYPETATGVFLDDIAAQNGIIRTYGESDVELRERIGIYNKPPPFRGIIHDCKITGSLVINEGADESDDRFPHECPHCSKPAYIGGEGTVDCSSCDGVMK